MGVCGHPPRLHPRLTSQGQPSWSSRENTPGHHPGPWWWTPVQGLLQEDEVIQKVKELTEKKVSTPALELLTKCRLGERLSQGTTVPETRRQLGQADLGPNPTRLFPC